MIDEQVHHKFKVFVGALDADGTVGQLAKAVQAWAAQANVAPKSVGVEYVESAGKLLLTIGYRDDEPGYPVSLTSVPVGRLDNLDDAAIARLEQQMGQASGKLARVICHELYVTDKRELLMVFMTQAT
jgi:hypothetical protein